MGGRQGTEVEVTIAGADLDEARALWFSHPGITGALKANLKFAVKIGPEVPPGKYDLRVSGLFGLSNPWVFEVGDRPESALGMPSLQPQAALALEPGAVYNGRATAVATEYFTFPAEAGQRVLVECAAARLDSRLRPILKVNGPSGEEIAGSSRGELLDFTASGKGLYRLSLHDVAYAGGPEYAYRLTVGAGPWLDFVWPPAAPPGAKADFTLYGRNLPGGQPAELMAADGCPLQKLTVALELPAVESAGIDDLESPASAALEGFSYRLPSPQGSSNAVFIGYAPRPLVAETEPNDRPEDAQLLTPPCEVAGQFQTASDHDYYRFQAKKGDVYWIEITSHRRGLPTSPFLLVQRESADLQEVYGSDANAGGPGFSTLSNDPGCRFEAKEDGLYRLLVRDLFGGTRRDPANVYQLSLRAPAPDFALVAVAEPLAEKKDDRSATPFGVLLRTGGTIAIRMIALRRDGFAGDIELGAEGLPPGVTCIPTLLAAEKSAGMLLLTAAEKAEPWTGAVRLVGKAKLGGTELVRAARGGTVLWPVKDYNVEPVRARLSRDIALAVSGAETAPLAIVPGEDKVWQAPVGGKLEIPFKVIRRGEFKEALKLKAAGLPALDAAAEIDVAPAADEVKATLDLAALKLPAGPSTIYLQAFAKGKFRGKDASMAVYSTPVRIEVRAP